MLVGSFRYNKYMFSMRGYDFGESLDFYIVPTTTKGRLFLDSGFHYEDGNIDTPYWKEFWVNITRGFIKCDKYMELYDGKKVYNSVNTEMLVSLGQIISGMKAGCNRTNMVSDDDLFSTGFNPKSLMTYEYDTGSISVRLQIIEKLDYVSKDESIEVHLENDFSYAEQIYQNANAQYKFKLNLEEFVVTSFMNNGEDWDMGATDRFYTYQEIIERNPHKSYGWLKKRKYYVLHSIEKLEEVCKYLWSFKVLAFDTETTGLNINLTSLRGTGDRLVGMIFSAEPGIAYYIPIAHKKFKNICTPGNEYSLIEKYIRPLLERRDILCHNGSFDWAVMHIYNICMNLKYDTYIIFKVTMGGDNPQLGLGLKELTHTFLNRDSFELSDFVDGKFGSNNIKFWDFDEDSAKYYACPDCDNLIELWEYTKKERLLEKYEAQKICEIETQFSIVIAYQQFYGHHVAIEKLDQLVSDIVESKEFNYKKMVEIVGHDFKPKSNKELPKVMYEELKMPVLGYTEANNPSTGKDVRKKLLEYENPDGSLKYPFVKYLSAYLDARTLESNFTKQIDKFSTEDGFMFSDVAQFLKTGRVSTSNPNYQGYSSVVKKYITPRNGFYAMDADYSSVEARIMCSMAGCMGMVEKMRDPDMDYHRQKASDMFSVPYELVTSALRQMSKGVNFGILYGLGDPNLGANLFGYKSPENTRKAAKQKKLYFKGMLELEPFVNESRSQGTTLGYSTTYFKRRRWYDSRKTRKDTIERQSCNARIQGTAADLYKLGMVRLFAKIKENGWVGKFLISAFVHDECFCEVSKSINPFYALKVLQDSMMIDIDGWAPLYIGAGMGSTWYEAKKTEIPVQVQGALIEKYSDNCPSWWQGDTGMLYNFIVDNIMEYKRDRVIDYLKDENNRGKVLNPTVNELCHELLKDIKGGQKVKGALDVEFELKKDVIECLEEFCKVFDCKELLEKADVRRPEISQDANTSDDLEEDDDEEIEEMDVTSTILSRLESLGVANVFGSDGKRVIYFRYEPNNTLLMAQVRRILEKEKGKVEVRTFQNNVEMTTGLYVDPKVYPRILQLYMADKNLKRQRG